MGPRLQLHTSQFLWRHPGWSQANMGASVGARYAKADAAERAAQREAREAPQDVAQLGWHRDIAEMTSVIGPGAMPRVEIKVMFYLSDCLGPGFGQTWVARGSHKWQPGGKGAWQGPEAKARIVEEGRGVEPRLRAGDALFFENRCFHSAGVNRSDQIRKTFVVGYSYRWMRPDDYNTQDEEFLRSVNPLERELMEMKGMNISRDGVWKAGGDATLLELIAEQHGQGKLGQTF